MSLDTVRDAISRAKKNEAATCSQTRRRKLRDLYAATTFTIKAPKSLQDFNFAAIPDPPELAFLDENDIEKGRYFSDSTLPFPSFELYPTGKSLESTTSTDPSSTSNPPVDASTPVAGDSTAKEASQAPLASALKATTPSIEATKQKTPRSARHAKAQVTVEVEQPVTRETPSAAENGIPEGSIHHANSAEQNPVAKRDGKTDDRTGPANTLPSGEAASSPSSTVGPYSTNTPHLNHPSPDTSPDEDSFPDGVHSIRKGASASEKNGDSALDASLSKKAPSQVQQSVATPDAQLRSEERLSSKSRQPSQPLTSSSQGQLPVSPIATPAGEDADAAQKISEARKARQAEPVKDPNAMDVDEPRMSGDMTAKQNGTRSEKANAQESVDHSLQTEQSQAIKPANAGVDSEDVHMDDADQIPLSASTVNEASASRGLRGTSADGLQSKRPANLQLDDGQAVESPEPLTTGKSIPDSARTPGDRPRSGKHRRRRSTVIFPKQTGESRLDSMQRTCLDYAALKGASQDEKKDYLQSLFECQAYTLPRAQPLDHLITTANKTLTTGNHAANILEQHDARILKRVYGLQNANRWSCRQMERSAEPPRPETVHDVLLRHVKNMRTDFREEKKWKVAVARNLANACAAWVGNSAEGRQAMQVRIKRKHRRDVSNSESGMQSPARSTPELIPSNGSETEQELLRDDDLALADPNETQPPAALFSLGIDDVIFKMEPTPIAESLLMELPQYDATKQNLSSELSQSIVPVSKFIGSKLASKHTGPPRKKRRYDYESEEDLPSYPSKRHALDHTISLSPSRRSTSLDLPAEQTNVALFNPENKHLRERLHASHAFRPPMEFPMPSTSFFESRQSSQWTWDEDQKLRGYVKDYSFNWSLISSHLQVSSLFNSGAERRTPWECFERWVQLEGLPAEMSKTPYFRTYQSRLEAAQRTIAAQQQMQQQQVQTPGSALGPPRRRTMQPMRVERRRNNRYLALVDAMRKLARKKEQLAHKHQEAAKAAALRKAHEAAHPKTSVHTPQEFSRLRQERDVKVREKQELLQQQMNAQNRQNAMMQRSGQMPGPNAAAAAAQQRNGPPRNPNGGNPSAGAQQGIQQANMGMQGRAQSQQGGVQNNFPNGLMPNMQMNNQNVGQMSMQQRMQILQQQRNFAGQNQAQGQFQNQQHLANMSANGQQMQNQAAMMAAMGVKVNGAMSPSANGMGSSAASPRLQQQNHQGQNHQPQPLSSGHVPAVAQISHQIQTQNPQLTPDQVRQLTADRLKNHMYQQQRQNALNSAAGTPSTSAPNGFNQANFQQTGMNGSPNPSYHQQLRQQMMQQQAASQASPQMNGANVSRSGTPQNAQGQAQGNGQHQRASSGSLNGGSPGIQSR